MLPHNISTQLILRRADKKLRAIAAEKAKREYLNRPHQQSEHMVGYPVEEQHPPPPDLRLGPQYIALVIAVIAFVAYINFLVAS